MRTKQIAGILLACMILFCVPRTEIRAQEIGGAAPGASRERSLDTRKYYELEERLKTPEQPPEKDVIEEAPEPEREELEPEEATVFIKKIVTDPSEVLSEEEIKRVTGRYEEKVTEILEAKTKEIQEE